MASTITAAEGYGYRVILTVTPDPADMGATITITRETGALPPVEVAGGVDLPAEATVVVVGQNFWVTVATTVRSSPR